MHWPSVRRSLMKTLRGAQHPARRTVHAAVAWSLLLFALNVVWELAQLPLYTISSNAEWPALVYAVLHCTLGDAAVALVAYLIAAVLTRSPRWPVGRPWLGLAVMLVAGEVFTVWAEWYNVYVLRSWGYAAGMPTIFGIGVAPLAQWLILPVVAVGIVRYQGEGVFQSPHRHRPVPIQNPEQKARKHESRG